MELEDEIAERDRRLADLKREFDEARDLIEAITGTSIDGSLSLDNLRVRWMPVTTALGH